MKFFNMNFSVPTMATTGFSGSQPSFGDQVAVMEHDDRVQSVVRKFTPAIVLGMALLFPLAVLAGAAAAQDTEFAELWTWLIERMQGNLGKFIAGGFVIIGIISGLQQGSLFAFAVGIGAAVGLYYAPRIINGAISATLPVL